MTNPAITRRSRLSRPASPRIGALLLVGIVLLAGSRPAPRAQTEEGERYRQRLAALERAVREAGSPAERSESLSALRAHVVAEADRLIDDRRYRSSTSERYRVMTDDPRIDPAAAVALLEEFHAFFDRFWSGRLDLGAEPGRSRVYLFYSFFKYNRLLTGEARHGDFRPPGHYRPLMDILVLHTDGAPPGSLPGVLIHEAAHQLVHRRLPGGGEGDAAGAIWLQEGIASYFGHTRHSRKDGFLEGRIGDPDVRLVEESPGTDGAAGAVPAARHLLGVAKRLARPSSGFSLDGLLKIREPEAFYGLGAEERYAASWTLVHALVHGRAVDAGGRNSATRDGMNADGPHAAGLFSFLRGRGSRAAPDAGDPAAALYEAVGLDAAALEAFWREHVAGLKAR